MGNEGFENTFEMNIDDMLDKTFHTFRKTKTNDEKLYFKWNPFNLVNKHFTRNGDQVMDNMMDIDLPKRIYQSRPALVLNIGNEYLSMMLMEELASKSRHLIFKPFLFRILQELRPDNASKTSLHQVR